MLLLLSFLNVNYYKGAFGVGNVDKSGLQSRIVDVGVEVFLECLTILLIICTVLFEGIEIIKKYIEDMILAYRRNKAMGRKWYQIFYSNEGNGVLFENLLG